MKADKGELKRAMGLTLVLLIMGVCVMLYCDWRGSFADTFYVCRKLFWVLPAFAVLLTIFYYLDGKGLSNRAYINRILPIGKENSYGNNPDRKVYLDYARVLAAVCVILTHACSMQRGEDVAAWRTCLLTVCAGLGLVCNPLYVMISGSLLLSSDKKESVGAFYYRRWIKVVIPMVVYYAVFLCVSGQMSFLPPKNLGKGFLQILAGESDIVPHYWLIYTLIALYVFAPLVKRAVRRLSDRQLHGLFWGILILELLLTVHPLVGVQAGFVLKLVGWEGAFILGYILTEKRNKVIENAVLIAGAVSAVIISVVLLKDYALLDYVCNTAPTMVLFAGAIMILLSKINHVLSRMPKTVVRVLAKYSYSIILVHWYGLFVVTWGKIGLQPLRFGCIGGIVLTVTVATVVCLVLGFVADQTIVFAVQYPFKVLGKATGKVLKKQ